MFFHSKLNLHNFTFYDLQSKKVMNYLWSEINGEIEASNFASCYIDYLTYLVECNPNVKVVTSWSDGCSYQNRCSVLSGALLSFAVAHQITIFHKYLEVGHTHMECDSVHSTIETKLKQVIVNLPSDYINIIQGARKKGEKYRVKYIDYTFFKDFKAVCDIKSVKSSKEVGLHMSMIYINFNTTLMVRYLLIWITLIAIGKSCVKMTSCYSNQHPRYMKVHC